MTAEQLEAEVLKRARSQRARLAELLLSSLDEDPEIDEAWDQEAERRHQHYLAGEEEEAIAAAEALAEVRAEELVAFGREVEDGIRRIAGSRSIRDIYAEEEPVSQARHRWP